jgi:glycine/D-amino acid oxidase-like deaminating enzyme
VGGTAVGHRTKPKSVAVIGAGIVGVSTALFLQRDGHTVFLIDRVGPAAGTSYGNAGGVVSAACAPLGMPGMLRQVPRMLMDPMGPLVVRWRYLPRITPWLVRLVLASRPSRVERIADALVALNGGVEDAWRSLVAQAGCVDLLRPVGWLKVFETDAGFVSTAADRDVKARRGIPFQVLNADELRQLEPSLAPIFKHGYLMPGCPFVANPGRAIACLAADFVERGGHLLTAAVTGFDLADRPYRVLAESGVVTETDVIVVAAGAWSRGLAKQLGASVPLDTERGYHLMLPPAEPGLGRPTIHGEHSFALCPMEEGTRLTSQVEFAGLDAPPDFRRVRGLLGAAKRMLPTLEIAERSAWLGFRPSLPDSLPIIGPVYGLPDVYLGFGHGHLGMTQGPVTGRILADLVADREVGIDLSPYRHDRF